MVWGPLETICPDLFARCACLTLLASCFLPGFFPPFVYRKHNCHFRGPENQSQDPELQKQFATIEDTANIRGGAVEVTRLHGRLFTWLPCNVVIYIYVYIYIYIFVVIRANLAGAVLVGLDDFQILEHRKDTPETCGKRKGIQILESLICCLLSWVAHVQFCVHYAFVPSLNG